MDQLSALLRRIGTLLVAGVILFLLCFNALAKTVIYDFSADETSVNRKSGITVLKGDARFLRSGGDYLNADQITIYRDAETRELIKIEAVGNVDMKEKDMTAKSERAVFYEQEERIELEGTLDSPAVVDDGTSRMEAPFIEYFRREDRMDASALLFSIGQEFQGDLDNGKTSEGLRKVFSDNNASLSDSAAVSAKEAGARWLITDGDKEYSVRRHQDKLSVYGSQVSGHVTVEVKESETGEKETEEQAF